MAMRVLFDQEKLSSTGDDWSTEPRLNFSFKSSLSGSEEIWFLGKMETCNEDVKTALRQTEGVLVTIEI